MNLSNGLRISSLAPPRQRGEQGCEAAQRHPVDPDQTGQLYVAQRSGLATEYEIIMCE
jgi:hypothetical protein